jgi:hypothetical protein
MMIAVLAERASSGLDIETILALAAGIVGLIVGGRFVQVRKREEANHPKPAAAEGHAHRVH